MEFRTISAMVALSLSLRCGHAVTTAMRSGGNWANSIGSGPENGPDEFADCRKSLTCKGVTLLRSNPSPSASLSISIVGLRFDLLLRVFPM
jgi:hypothetical protein